MTPTPNIWFSMPEAFYALDLDASTAERAAAFSALTPTMTAEERLPLFVTQEMVVRRMLVTGVGQAAYLVDVIDGRLTVAEFSVSARAAGVADDGLLGSMARRYAERTTAAAEVVELPAGSALRVIDDHRIDDGRTVRQIDIVVPFPDRRYVAAFTLRTECLDDWPLYERVCDDVAATLSFDPPPASSPVSSITAVLSGLG